MPNSCRNRKPTGDAAPIRDAARRSVNPRQQFRLDLGLVEVIAGGAEAGDHRTQVGERAIDLDDQLGEALGDDPCRRIGAHRLLEAIEALHERRDIDRGQADVGRAGRQIPAKRRQQLPRPLVGAGDGADDLEQVADVVRDAIDGAGHGGYVVAASSSEIAALAGIGVGDRDRALGEPGTSVLGKAP